MSNRVRGRGVIDLRKGNGNRAPAGTQARAALPFRPKASLRARRRKLRALSALVLLAALAALVWGVSAFSYSPRFAIQDVAVSGTEEIPAQIVSAYVLTKLYDGTNPLLSRENIFLYPRAEIEKSVSEYFPRVRTALISREGLLAQVITVTVSERQPFAIWCSDGEIGNGQKSGDGEGEVEKECFEMDNGGFIFAPLEAGSKSISTRVVFSGGLATSTVPIGQTFLPEYFDDVLSLISRLGEQGFSVKGVSAEDGQDFAVSLSEGFALRAPLGADANAIVRDLELALSSEPLRGKESKLEYIDLRFGNRVYYKNKI